MPRRHGRTRHWHCRHRQTNLTLSIGHPLPFGIAHLDLQGVFADAGRFRLKGKGKGQVANLSGLREGLSRFGASIFVLARCDRHARDAPCCLFYHCRSRHKPCRSSSACWDDVGVPFLMASACAGRRRCCGSHRHSAALDAERNTCDLPSSGVSDNLFIAHPFCHAD